MLYDHGYVLYLFGQPVGNKKNIYKRIKTYNIHIFYHNFLCIQISLLLATNSKQIHAAQLTHSSPADFVYLKEANIVEKIAVIFNQLVSNLFLVCMKLLWETLLTL